MSNVVLTGVPHSGGMSNELLAEIDAWFNKGFREHGSDIFEHNRERLWLYHAIEEVKKRRIATDQRRERIATAALQGLCSDPDLGDPERVAELAVRFADALIKEIEG